MLKILQYTIFDITEI